MDYNINSDDDFEGSYNSSNKDMMNNNENTQTKNPNGLSKAELRRSNKPIMEKRRRARINHCLNELKSLILEAMKKDPARHTKLEKADILEMTVKHLQSIQRRQLSMAIQTDPTVIHKFKTGFVECAEEVKRYIGQLDGVDTGTRQRLSNYLNNCASSLDQIGSFTNFSNGYGAHSVQNFNNAAVFPNQMGYPVPHDANNNGRTQIGGVNLIPSLLPSGELALIMPNTKVNLIKPNINETLPFSVRSVPTINDDFTTNFPRASAFSKPSTKRVFSTPNYHDINASVPVSVTTTSPPLSPISSSSSQEEDSMMHTSSDFASRSITPSLDHSHSSVSGSELTTPSSAESSKVFSRIADLQQLNGIPKTEADICPKRLYPYGNSDELTVKKIKFEKRPNTDDNGNPKKAPAAEEASENMWRPW